GPGIGGFKEESEVGVALRAGHPVYFVTFFPEPEAGQTIEDIGRAEVMFIRKVGELHPEADGKPVVVGNCQAGWAIMMVAAAAPHDVGIVAIAGSPLSYWAGVEGMNPMRYTGGLLGGTWLTSLAGDLGNGKFDGAHLVRNFESLDPANTYWGKLYNLYSKISSRRWPARAGPRTSWPVPGTPSIPATAASAASSRCRAGGPAMPIGRAMPGSRAFAGSPNVSWTRRGGRRISMRIGATSWRSANRCGHCAPRRGPRSCC